MEEVELKKNFICTLGLSSASMRVLALVESGTEIEYKSIFPLSMFLRVSISSSYSRKG